MMKKGY